MSTDSIYPDSNSTILTEQKKLKINNTHFIFILHGMNQKVIFRIIDTDLLKKLIEC